MSGVDPANHLLYFTFHHLFLFILITQSAEDSNSYLCCNCSDDEDNLRDGMPPSPAANTVHKKRRTGTSLQAPPKRNPPMTNPEPALQQPLAPGLPAEGASDSSWKVHLLQQLEQVSGRLRAVPQLPVCGFLPEVEAIKLRVSEMSNKLTQLASHPSRAAAGADQQAGKRK